MRTEKIDTSTNNFSNFTFQDHRLKFRSSFLTSIGIAFSRVDSEKFVTSVDRCRIHLEAMMKLLSAEVKKSKTNDNANDGTQIFESEKTVASLTEVGGCNIFKYIRYYYDILLSPLSSSHHYHYYYCHYYYYYYYHYLV